MLKLLVHISFYLYTKKVNYVIAQNNTNDRGE